MRLAKEFLDVELKEDCKSEPVLEFEGETLRYFLESESIPFNTPMKVINQYLINSGIQPIDEEYVDTVKWVEDKLMDYMGDNKQVALSKEETKRLFNSFIEGYFSSNDVFETDLEHLLEINDKMWEIALNHPNDCEIGGND